ncbi:hypothetical protein [Nostoc sp. 'Peltigera membranacea cyanobiont' 210A]|uniref:hypothetical protein n=1 Tax=Nostoc sp. 'Peltigera membranacea cyanobiont' 210A TaxID=2014529 RepID=UPI00167F094F|nr:hypothetical protein [Nostoc sp. 'Peltigera membranacea cyanobiont' 210A]
MRNPRGVGGVGGVGGWGRSLTPHTPHTPLPPLPTLCVRNPGQSPIYLNNFRYYCHKIYLKVDSSNLRLRHKGNDSKPPERLQYSSIV